MEPLSIGLEKTGVVNGRLRTPSFMARFVSGTTRGGIPEPMADQQSRERTEKRVVKGHQPNEKVNTSMANWMELSIIMIHQGI